ncbi:hypothetical protein GC209_04040 [bacterium]|nr:hypothetical protein [bacterium]
MAALILAGLTLTCLGIFGWLWLCGGAGQAGWRGFVGKQAVQLSGVCLALGLVTGHPINGVFMASFPPLALGEVARARPFAPFLAEVAWHLAPFAGAALLVSLILPPLRVWSLGVTLLAALAASLWVGDQVSRDAMCRAALKRGFAGFERNSFAYSLANTRGDPVYDSPHAVARAAGQTLGWSYRDMDWFVLPRGIAGSEPAFTCAKA